MADQPVPDTKGPPNAPKPNDKPVEDTYTPSQDGGQFDGKVFTYDKSGALPTDLLSKKSSSRKKVIKKKSPSGQTNSSSSLSSQANQNTADTAGPTQTKPAQDEYPTGPGGSTNGANGPPSAIPSLTPTSAPTPTTNTPPPTPPSSGTNNNTKPNNSNNNTPSAPPGGPLKGVGTNHVSGTLTINGHGYKFGSGSSNSFPHIPYGTYPINGPATGAWGRAHNALEINHNNIYDSSIGRNRAGIEIHASAGGYTLGCIGVDPNTYPALRSEILNMIATQGSAYLTVGPNGAYIAPAGQSPAPGAAPPSGTQYAGTNGIVKSVTGSGSGYTDVQMADGTVQHREGDLNWRNNNPGNIRAGSFANSQGAIGSAGGFAVFPTLQAGRTAMQNLLFNSPAYAGTTIAEAISNYAPPSQNNTADYIKTVSSALGLPSNTPMSSLTPAQQQTMLDTMTKYEGFKAGSINGIPVSTAGNTIPNGGGTGGVTGGGTGGQVLGPTGQGLYPSSSSGLNVANGAFSGGQPQPVMLSFAQFLQQNIKGFQSVTSFTSPSANAINTANTAPYQQGLALDFTIVNPTYYSSIVVTRFIQNFLGENNINGVVINYYLNASPITDGYIHIEIPSGIPAQQALYTFDIITAFNAQLTGITIK